MTDLLTSLFSTHLPVLPVLLPLFTAVALLLMGDQGGEANHGGPLLQRRRLLLRRMRHCSVGVRCGQRAARRQGHQQQTQADTDQFA